MGTKRVYPLDYRSEEVDFILRRWRSGTSICVVGVGSAGKSNLLHHLLETATREHFLKDDAQTIIPVVIDSNMLGPLAATGSANVRQMRCWSAYELMLHQVYLTLHPFRSFPQATVDRITDSYHALHDGRNPILGYMALRYFELVIDTVVQSGMRLVFVFDEFDEMLRQIPDDFFRALRAIRDAHKRVVSFTAFTRAPLPALLQRFGFDPADLEPFVELFTDNLLFLGPFSPRDAQRFAADLNARAGQPFSTEALAAIQDVAGGHAGLMRAVFSELRQGVRVLDGATLDVAKLLTCPAPYTEAETIWKGLTPSEQRVLKAVSRLKTYTITEETEQAIQLLIRRRLLVLERPSQKLVVQPPIFAEYVRLDPQFT